MYFGARELHVCHTRRTVLLLMKAFGSGCMYVQKAQYTYVYEVCILSISSVKKHWSVQAVVRCVHSYYSMCHRESHNGMTRNGLRLEMGSDRKWAQDKKWAQTSNGLRQEMGTDRIWAQTRNGLRQEMGSDKKWAQTRNAYNANRELVHWCESFKMKVRYCRYLTSSRWCLQ